MSLEGVLQEIKKKNLLAVRFEQMVPTGLAKSKTVLASHVEEVARNGLGICLVHLASDYQGDFCEGTGYGNEIKHGDGLYFPLLETFRVLPWVERIGRVLIEPTFKGEAVEGYPRVVARRQLEKLKGLGISLLSAHEHEFYVFHKETMKPMDTGCNGHITVRNTPINKFLQDIMEYLPRVGVDLEQVMTENGPGQLEITYKPAFGVQAADNAHTYKTSIKEIAILNGYVTSFMSKPHPGKSGSSGHFCHSLWDADGERSLLYDPTNPGGLSKLGQHWIAGILAHAPAIQILMGPTVNCFRRLEPNIYAPVNATWGIDNRTCLLRVRIKGERGTYIEHRGGAAAANPYLSLAATVAAGIDGIVNKLPLPAEVTGDAYVERDVPADTAALPRNLEDALNTLLDDKVICGTLGEDFLKCFSAIKRREIDLARDAEGKGNKDWEFKQYFMYL